MLFGRCLWDYLPHLPSANDLEVADAKLAVTDNRKQLMEQQEIQHGTFRNLKAYYLA